MKRALAATLAAGLLAGCGGGRSADDVLKATAGRMDAIRSADVRLRLVLEPSQDVKAGQVGFALDGPVALDRRDGLPTARLRYTQIAGPQEGGATFIADGRDAFVDTGDGVYRLGDEQNGALTASAGAVSKGIELPLGRWIESAERKDGDRLDGVDVDHVSARLDAVAALRDIFGAASAAGAAVPDLSGANAAKLDDAIDSATLDLWAGREDRLLRRLRVRLSFGAKVPDGLRERLGDFVGGRIAFDVDLSRLNRPVRVETPESVAGTLPAPAG